VRHLIQASLADARYYPPGGTINSLDTVNGAKLLTDLFNELSETRVLYDKIKHSVELVKYILSNGPEELREIVDLLTGMLGADE
jgi:hypothetical protein